MSNKPSCLQSITYTDRMNGSTINPFPSASTYYWAECNSPDYSDDGIFGVPTAGFIILSCTYCFEFLAGAPSNLWLISHILRKRSKGGGVLPADFYPLHLALTHLFFYLNLPIFFATYVWQNVYALAMVMFLTSLVLVMKPLLLCLVCVERYLAVVRPLDYLRFKANRYRWGSLGISWCIYVFMALLAIKRHSVPTVCIVFPPVLVIDTICSLSVLKTLQKSPPGDKKMMEKEKKEDKRKAHPSRSRAARVKGGEQEQKEEKKEENVKKVARRELREKVEMNLMKRKAFHTIVILQAFLTLNYLPFIITFLLGFVVSARTLKCELIAMALAAAASCSYLQPLLYLHKLGRLRCKKSQN